MSSENLTRSMSISSRIQDLAPWFHNLHLPDGSQTAPQHPLGDFPAKKWKQFSHCLPDILEGWHVLDIGCNAGYYSFQLAARGARVTAVDINAHYLTQARWAATLFGVQDRVQFQQKHVYDLARSEQLYDLVVFMGVFYHLRYPLLALDIAARRTRHLMLFQTLMMPGEEVVAAEDDRDLNAREAFLEPGWPKMAFIENALAGDPSNWWVANHAGVLALLRSSGLRLIDNPAHEIYLCEPTGETGWTADLINREIRAACGT